MSVVKVLNFSCTPQHKEDMSMLFISNVLSAFRKTKVQDSILILLVLGLIGFGIKSYFTSDTSIEPECTRYCSAKAEPQALPSEAEYFQGIDNYEERFPEMVKKYRLRKQAELNN